MPCSVMALKSASNKCQCITRLLRSGPRASKVLKGPIHALYYSKEHRAFICSNGNSLGAHSFFI